MQTHTAKSRLTPEQQEMVRGFHKHRKFAQITTLSTIVAGLTLFGLGTALNNGVALPAWLTIFFGSNPLLLWAVGLILGTKGLLSLMRPFHAYLRYWGFNHGRFPMFALVRAAIFVYVTIYFSNRLGFKIPPFMIFWLTTMSIFVGFALLVWIGSCVEDSDTPETSAPVEEYIPKPTPIGAGDPVAELLGLPSSMTPGHPTYREMQIAKQMSVCATDNL